MKRLLLFALCAALCLFPAGCGEDATEKEPTATTSSTTTQKTYSVTYVPDETVNRFILKLKEHASLEIQGIEQGSSQGEYVLMLNECYVTLAAYPHGLSAIILGGRDERAQQKLFTVFTQLARAADESCTEQQINDAIAFMEQQTSSSPSYRVSNYVKIVSYLPSVTLESIKTDCRLDLVFLNYTSSN